MALTYLDNFSMPRNPIIAKIFRILNLAENIGSGFHKMINGWKSFYNIEPVISGDFDYYKIIFPLKVNTTDGGVNGGLSGEVNKLLYFIKQKSRLKSSSNIRISWPAEKNHRKMD